MAGTTGLEPAASAVTADDINCQGNLAMTGVLRRSGKLGMQLRDEFLTPLRYYK